MNIIEHIPHFLREVREFKSISNIEKSELGRLKTEIETVLNNQFIKTADENGLLRFESFIESYVGVDDDLETRRKKLLLMTSENRPYTLKKLKGLLENVFGENAFELSLNNFELNVTISPTFDSDIELVKIYLAKILPANIFFKVTQGEEISKFNTYERMTQFTHSQLSSFTHAQIEEGI